ncbi:MerR family transcriptional regulator [Acutalibacter sp. 1XD8-36]|uniref:MerR family transcriptional regulator n=2 Tax=Acutalibacter TaxID=1918385 RepID=UPI00137216F6|nr:MerR family transcriptional regulator [Acutalibacter sp. 1XD8-36]NBJ90620.1 MerR family transcriptional regulator [Acutalibacter sp. 1XD8-36]NBK80240.1 MerR family transcriptional regulator [bacterium D16-76]
MKNELMLIGEIADFFGISRKAMRLYEKKGIIKPVKVDTTNGYRYYSAEQVQQLNALIELKALGFSLDEIKMIIDGKTSKTPLLEMLEKKRQAWQEAIDSAKYKEECLDNIIRNLQGSQTAEKITVMTEEERAWLLVKMVCIEDVKGQKVLSEALWV